jgi:6,7-dimethyl-8-ribityllumazine synthase
MKEGHPDGLDLPKPMFVDKPGVAAGSQKVDRSGMQIGIVSAREHGDVVKVLVDACRGELMLKGVDREHIHEAQVALPFELPYATKRLIRSAPMKIDAVICVGCTVRGNSLSYEFIGEAVTRACMMVGMMTKTPVVYGLTTCTSEELARAGAGLAAREPNNGIEWAQAAIEMAHMNQKACAKMKKACKCACH